ncbi:MAG: DedA family protein [Myxococcota bacterium]|nr:DedA family protein [Myxococcota bacterium]
MLISILKAALTVVAIGATNGGPGRWIHGLVSSFLDPDWNEAHRHVIWATIIFILFFAGIGLPLPEDIPLTISGFTTFKLSGDRFVLVNYALTMAAVIVPILAGDLLTYSIGRRWGFSLPARVRLIGRLLPEKRLARVQRWFDHYGNFTVFLGRQIAGVRFVTFFSAGAMRMPVTKFILFDFLGCLVSVPIWLTLGTLAAIHGKEWLDVVSRKVGRGVLLSAVGLFLLFYVILKVRSALRARRVETEHAAPVVESPVVETKHLPVESTRGPASDTP